MTGAVLTKARDRRALMIGAFAVVALLLTRGVPLLRGWAVRAATAAQASGDRLTDAQRVIAALPAMRDSLATRARLLEEVESSLLSAGTPARVAADLSAFVSGAARDAGLDVLSASAMSDTATTSVLLRATVRLDTQGDISGLTEFLLLVELAPGLLQVREFSLSQPEPAAPPNRPEQLRASFVVEGVAPRARPAPASGASTR